MNKEFIINIGEYKKINNLCSYNETIYKSKFKDIEEHYIKIVGNDYDDCNGTCVWQVPSQNLINNDII